MLGGSAGGAAKISSAAVSERRYDPRRSHFRNVTFLPPGTTTSTESAHHPGFTLLGTGTVRLRVPAATSKLFWLSLRPLRSSRRFARAAPFVRRLVTTARVFPVPVAVAVRTAGIEALSS